MKKNHKAKKWQLYAAIGAASVVVLGAGGILLFRQPSQTAVKDEPTHLVVAKEGSVASSVLLSGTVTAKNEQYVYFDASKGDLDEILVSVGDKVSEGQALVKYSMIQPAEQSRRQTVISMNSIKHEMKLLQLPSYQYQQEAKELQGKLQLQSQEMQCHLLMHN